MIYTASFSDISKLPKNVVLISISEETPKWYNGLQYKALFPKNTYFITDDANKKHNYDNLYRSTVLNNLSTIDVLLDLQRLGSGKDVALICYEKPTDFCHRHLVADWLNQNGIKCEEWGAEK